ncbi:sigma-54-dependent Fis family transcriptional regulator [Shewanella sp. WXL01]|uniref:Sigma-54-dependent Fis family transcriptional regulator n=1 Tax=Shewanella maritima TaxID=2520507 RepID=A0A411PFV0_9GAMM|nr:MULTISPECIES: response regulator [Shewanella]NKF49470.1 sigma-54-dependent Fis family transcriptional regulator [Shewanella sp. WXL01]QBF82425.1 sigma-54-dependent Fis family transcriptional regulator [Shewanella maritima]
MKLYRSILIVDDETRWLRAMAVSLRQEVPEARVSCCENSRHAIDMIIGQDIDLVLLDLNMPHIGGEELLDTISEQAPFTRVIVVTGANDTATAVRCVKRGAYDFFVKGGRPEQLIACIRRALEVAALEVNYREVTQSFLGKKRLGKLPGIISQSSKMNDCIRYATALTRSSYPVVIESESGGGKRTFATGLAQLMDEENSAAHLQLEQFKHSVIATLFGRVRGVNKVGEPAQLGFFEQNRGRVVILEGLFQLENDVINSVVNALISRQYYPLGSVQHMPLPCKVLVLTELPLQQLRDQGKVTPTQFVALHTHHIVLPPLRERPEDIGLLAAQFMQDACEHLNKPLIPLCFELVQQLEQESWPGNVAELRARVFKAVALGNLQALVNAAQNTEPDPDTETQVSFPNKLPTLSEVQQLLIHEALKRCNYSQVEAAKLLGISQSALSRRLR